MPPKILTLGSLHYDIMVHADHLPRRDETAVGSRWYPKFGGKGGNQAVAVARAGAHSVMFGAVGDDDFGQFLRQNLRAAGVDDAYVATLPAPSGMSVAIMDGQGDYAATIVSGANLDLKAAALNAPDLWQDAALLILQNEVPDSINLAAAIAAQARQIPILLNAAPARALPRALIPLISVLVVNAVEAEMMGADPVTDLVTAAAAAAKLCNDFKAVIVTVGAQGLAAQSQDAQFTLPAERVKALSSHGAGDAFIGTLAAGLAQGAPLQNAAQAASKAAALHVAKPST